MAQNDIDLEIYTQVSTQLKGCYVNQAKKVTVDINGVKRSFAAYQTPKFVYYLDRLGKTKDGEEFIANYKIDTKGKFSRIGDSFIYCDNEAKREAISKLKAVLS